MSEETPIDPAHTLAEEVVKKLIDEGLVSSGKRAEILGKLTAGTAKAEDWGLWTELALPEEDDAQDESQE